MTAAADILAVRPEAISDSLRNLPQWVVWRLEQRGDKPTKVPYQPCGRHADSTDPTTWCSHLDALAAYQCGGWSGIGFALSANDPFTAVDLDHCRDAATGVIEPWAVGIIERLRSYSEISPSGTGIRILLKARKPAGRCRKDQIEIYDRTRYVTVTGHHLDGTPETVEDRQAELDALHAEIFPPAERNGDNHVSQEPVDEELLKRVRAGGRLPQEKIDLLETARRVIAEIG